MMSAPRGLFDEVAHDWPERLALIVETMKEMSRQTDPQEMSRAYGRPGSAALRHIVGPSFAPFLFAAIRNSFASAWKLAALAEAFGGTTGVGVQIRTSFQTFSTANLMAWTMFFVLFVNGIERLVLMRFERHVFRYRLRRGEDALRF